MERIKGGRGARVLEGVMPLEIINNEGKEGVVYGVNTTVTSKSGAVRGLRMAEKVFRPLTSTPMTLLWKNPRRQVEYMQELKALERKEGLGLRLPATFRLRDRFDGMPAPMRWFLKLRRWAKRSDEGLSVLMTKFDSLRSDQRDDAAMAEYLEDSNMQMAAAKRHGYIIRHDAFFPCRDVKTGKMIAVLADLGNCEKDD
ncbi:MAG: hypothetical protein V1875_01550 [Candidatus Altiarchaeota archaeon]